MEVRGLERAEYSDWDVFVEQSPQGSVFSQSWFLDSLGAQYKIVAGFEKNGSLQCGMVMPRAGVRGYTNPIFVKYLGFIEKEDPRVGANLSLRSLSLQQKFIPELPADNFDYIFHPDYVNWSPFYWAGFKQETRYTYVISDLKTWDSVWGKFQGRVRTSYRKAEKSNIVIDQDVKPKEFYSVYRLSFERQGGFVPITEKRFVNLVENLSVKSAVSLIGGRDENGVLHSVAGVVSGMGTSYLMWNGFNHRLPQVGANTFVIANAVRESMGKSSAFDFEGSMIEPIQRFYVGFGGVLTAYSRIWKPTIFRKIITGSVKLAKKLVYRK